MNLTILDGLFAVCRLGSADVIPDWAQAGRFLSVTRTEDELSIVCAQERVPPEARSERDFRVVKVEGPLDFALVGVLSSLTAILAAADISLLAVSTYDTDYILVRDRDLPRARTALESAGHSIRPPTVNG